MSSFSFIPFIFEIITQLYHFFLYFLLSKFPIYPSLLSFKLLAFFISCCYMNICICLCIYIPTYILFSMFNVTCLYLFRTSRLILNNLLIVLPGEDCSSCSQLSLVVSSSLCGVEALWLLPSSLWHDSCCPSSAHV